MKDIIQQLFKNVQCHWPTSTKIAENSVRLDAPFYSNVAESARISLSSCSLPTSNLSEIAKVFALSDFSLGRIPADEAHGVPFYTFSDILEHDPSPTMFLSKKHEPNLQNYIVQEGWILLSRAGTIGNTFMVGPELAGVAVANHAIRIVPYDSALGALIYVLIRSQLGQQIIGSLMYGAVVDVIKPAQLENVLIPIPSKRIMDEIEARVRGAVLARTNAIRLNRQADKMLHKSNALQQLRTQSTEVCSDVFQPTTFKVLSKSVWLADSDAHEFRLDAHYYNPTAALAVSNIKKCPSNIKTIKEVANVFMGPRFKRNYVESAHGVPFLSGKNIVQIRPALKHLSNLQMAYMQELIVKRGWSLVTCSGTIGRTCFVWDNYEEFAASQHILRVMPIDTEIDPAYLNAFLASRYGYEQILRFRYGSVIDEITDKQIGQVLVPCPSRKEQETIGDMVRKAYESRAEAIRLEDEAQEILNKELQALPEGR